MNTDRCSSGKFEVWLLQISGHNIFVEWSIHNLVLSELLLEDPVFNMLMIHGCWTLYGSWLNTASPMCIFSTRCITVSWCWGSPGVTLALHLGAISNRKITNRKHRSLENTAVNLLHDGCLFTIHADAETRGRGCLLSLSQELKTTTTLIMPTAAPKRHKYQFGAGKL